ncbi:hypothetical protein EVAR_27791_1 [Eumeta japonica]|uniref:Uncharacterized protein n=1 Tax=Eumeta variegata TaxID=151549 RepID=A0A4C1VI35_EUMVA|nr:hypothetical protein EVAR_27791_1 [Eumeta japonica]
MLWRLRLNILLYEERTDIKGESLYMQFAVRHSLYEIKLASQVRVQIQRSSHSVRQFYLFTDVKLVGLGSGARQAASRPGELVPECQGHTPKFKNYFNNNFVAARTFCVLL